MDDFLKWGCSILDAMGLTAFVEPAMRIYYPYLLSALLMASIFFYYQDKKSSNPKSKLLAYLFPSNIWLHQSAIVDYQLFVFNNLLKIFLIAPYLIANGTCVYMVIRYWEHLIGIQDTVVWSSTNITITYTIVFLLVSDFSRFIVHYCLHKIPFLWHFHKVHHAAEVLTPMTLYRIHPLEYYLFSLRSVLVFGVVTGTFLFWFRTGIEPLTILQIHIGLFFFNLLGANLRHSHVPISFGKLFEHIFISPAQHQIHHGSQPQYFDKNFGSLFAFWDWIFGSLFISSSNQKIEYGIEKEEQEEYRSLLGNIWMPIRKLLRNLKI